MSLSSMRGSASSTPRSVTASARILTPSRSGVPHSRSSSSGVTFRPPDADGLSLSLSGASVSTAKQGSQRGSSSASRRSLTSPAEGRLLRFPTPENFSRGAASKEAGNRRPRVPARLEATSHRDSRITVADSLSHRFTASDGPRVSTPASFSFAPDSLDILDSVSSFEANERSFLELEEQEAAEGAGAAAPSNQIGPVSPGELKEAEAFIHLLNSSAAKIQSWYRRHSRRRKAGEAALKRLLAGKKEEVERKKAEERNLSEQERLKEEEAKKRREEKAKEARQRAILELAKKREAKKAETKRIAEEEVKRVAERREVIAKKKKKNSVLANLAKNVNLNSPPIERESYGDSTTPPEKMRSVDGSPERGQVDDNSLFGTWASGSALHSERDRSEKAVNGDDDDVASNEDTASRFSRDTKTLEAGPSTVAGNAALEDLLDSLKTLEADDVLDAGAKKNADKKKKGPKWLEEIDAIESGNSNFSLRPEFPNSETSSSSKRSGYLDAGNLQRLSLDGNSRPASRNGQNGTLNASLRSAGSVSSLLSDGKLQSILDFLNQVEKASNKDKAMVERQRVELKNRPLPTVEPIPMKLVRTPSPAPPVVDVEEQLELQRRAVSDAASEVSQTVKHLRMELEEKSKTIEKLQRSLAQQRELTVRHAKETEREMTHRLHLQKDEYEQAIQRHLSFIDQLIDDKKSLGEKCENLVSEMKKMEKKFNSKMQTLTDNHRVELERTKELHAAAEKMRREKWVEEKTKKIKEITVKGLEPEIQKLIGKHKAEVKKLKSLHEAEILASDERAAGKYVQATEDLRDQLNAEKERAIARERELSQKKFDQQLDDEMKALETQRRRLYNEVQEEKDRLAEQAARQRAELDRIQIRLEDTHQKTANAIAEEYEKAKKEQNAKHQMELKELKDRMEVEKTSWMENIMKKQESVISQKERELKEKVRKERDNEIEAVIARLEEDLTNSKEEAEIASENRVKRIQQKCDIELKEMEAGEKAALEKYNEMKSRLLDVESNAERLKSSLRQKTEALEQATETLDRLKTERGHASEIIRQEFADRIVATDEENKRVRMEMNEMKARHRHELERARNDVEKTLRDKDDELEEVHKRVKSAIMKKEETVASMRDQYHAAVKRADHLEGLLEQQRKQLLGAVASGKNTSQRKN